MPPTKSDLKRSSAASAAFHSHYASLYGDDRWDNSLFPALLEPTRHAALINTFADPQLEGETTELGCIIQDTLTPPKAGKYLSHYNLDAASLLATHALDPQPGELILDMCAAPGGKAIALAQHAVVHANELDTSRNKRLAANLKAYLPPDRYKVLKLDGTKAAFQKYDKVLVDAPCSSERHLIHARMMDWKLSNTLPKTQLALLLNAIKTVKAGGRVVYATCSLSDLENDGVIEKCLHKGDVELLDDPFYDSMTEKTKHGRIALPDHSWGGSWGPIYFAVLRKKGS
jgi:16S rRNA C967 or C1407 C5-methylase (RsmB/RsmF family)